MLPEEEVAAEELVARQRPAAGEVQMLRSRRMLRSAFAHFPRRRVVILLGILVSFLLAGVICCGIRLCSVLAGREGPVMPSQIKSFVIYNVDPAWGAEVVAVERENDSEMWVTVRERDHYDKTKMSVYSVYGFKIGPEDTARIVRDVRFEKTVLWTPFLDGADLVVATLDDGSKVRMQIPMGGGGHVFRILGQRGHYRTYGDSNEALNEAAERYRQELSNAMNRAPKE